MKKILNLKEMEIIMINLDKTNFSLDDITALLDINTEEELNKLYEYAYNVKLETVDNCVYFRGIIELSNICDKDCYYCGIRKSNEKVNKFLLKKETVLESAKWCYEQNYASLVLQAGECQSENFIEYITDLVKEIKKLSNNELGITLSMGEQTKETYQKWFDAGAHRYLLRIETSNPDLYKSIHPDDHLFEVRKQCLIDLKEIGYQVGTGVLIGFPGQTTRDLAKDILFFKENDIDMIGMGPYVVHSDTPLGQTADNSLEIKKYRLELAIKMIAVARIVLKDINIASTTALQALDPIGREKGLKAGANIIMPVITSTEHRQDYLLYEDKPCIDDEVEKCRTCIVSRIESVGDKVILGKWGDSPHFKKKKI